MEVPHDAIATVAAAADHAQMLIAELHSRDPSHETFEQFGLLDGASLVHDFIAHGEWGIALEHLLYMIHEADIEFPSDIVVKLHDIATAWGLSSHYGPDNAENLTPEQRAFIFNAPWLRSESDQTPRSR